MYVGDLEQEDSRPTHDFQEMGQSKTKILMTYKYSVYIFNSMHNYCGLVCACRSF